jgi:hypothetical protein
MFPSNFDTYYPTVCSDFTLTFFAYVQKKKKKNALAHASSLTLQSHPQVDYQVLTLIKQFAEN